MAFTAKAVFLLLLSVLALCQASSNGNTVTERILHGFKDVTTLSHNNLRMATQKINNINAPQQGSIIAQGFTDIIGKIAHGTEKMSTVTSGPLQNVDAKLVVQSLTTFVQVQQALLNVVIYKHGLLTLVPFFEPIRVSLVNLEAAIDIFALNLIALIPTQKPAAEKQFASLSITLKQAQDTYSPRTMTSTSTSEVTEKILQGIKNVTAMSDSLRIATEQINQFNAAQQGIIIAEGFTAIVAKIAEGTTRVDSVSTGPLPDIDAQLVVQALTTFVHVHQALLNVVIGKHGILALFPFIGPIRVSLVSLEAAIDKLALNLIALIPTQKPAAQEQFDSLSITLKQAQNTYSQLNLPSASEVTEKILQGIKNVTAMSDSLRIATEQINQFNAAQQGIIIAEGFTAIVAKIAEGTTRVDSVSTGPLPDVDAQLVVQALTTFVHVHQALLNVVIGKHGILALFPFIGPIRVSLVSLEAAIDKLALNLIALIPTQKPAAQEQFDSLSITLKQAQNTYSQLNLPSASEVTEKILQGIKNVTAMSDSLRIATEQINQFNAAQQGIIIAEGFTAIVAKIAEGTTRVDSVSTGPLPDVDAQLVVQALTTFVHVHQALLNVVIGKHGILALFPFIGPIRVSLVSLEAAIDKLALNLIALIPTQKPAAQEQFDSLSITLKQAQNTYSQLNLPSASEVTEKILQGIKNVTAMSDSLRIATEQINQFNAAQQGIIIAEGFTAIVAKIAEGTTRVDSVSTGPLPDVDAQLVVQALTTFVHVHQALLNVVIGKHGILALFPFIGPIRVSLVSLEAAIDKLALNLIALIPTQKPAAQDQFDLLSITLKQAQNTYSQLIRASVAQY